MKAKVMVQVADRRLEMEDLEVPKVGTAEALLRVEACGLCGSDVEQYRGGFVKKGMATYPVIPGHEPVGIIEEIGADAGRRTPRPRGNASRACAVNARCGPRPPG